MSTPGWCKLYIYIYIYIYTYVHLANKINLYLQRLFRSAKPSDDPENSKIIWLSPAPHSHEIVSWVDRMKHPNQTHRMWLGIKSRYPNEHHHVYVKAVDYLLPGQVMSHSHHGSGKPHKTFKISVMPPWIAHFQHIDIEDFPEVIHIIGLKHSCQLAEPRSGAGNTTTCIYRSAIKYQHCGTILYHSI